MTRIRDKYPKLSTRRKFGIQFGNDHPNYEIKNGLVHEVGKIVFSPLLPEDFCKSLVDVGFLVKDGKGSQWHWVDEHYTSQSWREYPYHVTNTIKQTEKEQ